MHRYCTFFILTALCFSGHSTSFKDAKHYARLHWLFLHYHKTGMSNWKLYMWVHGHNLLGAFLSEAIAQSVSADRFKFKSDNSKRHPFSTHNRADVILSHAGNLLFNWTTNLVTPRFQYRVIHFVRDPYLMVLSGFLYHSQSPPPERECDKSNFTYEIAKHDHCTIIQTG